MINGYESAKIYLVKKNVILNNMFDKFSLNFREMKRQNIILMIQLL